MDWNKIRSYRDKLVVMVSCLKYRIMYGKQFTCGNGIFFRKNFNLACLGSGRVDIGNNVFFNNNCSIMAYDKIVIGDNTIFGENVKVYDHNHVYEDMKIPIAQQGYKTAPIEIGSNCWIASNVVILKGTKIGDHCIIGAGCIIYKDVPAHSRVLNKQQLQIR